MAAPDVSNDALCERCPHHKVTFTSFLNQNISIGHDTARGEMVNIGQSQRMNL